MCCELASQVGRWTLCSGSSYFNLEVAICHVHYRTAAGASWLSTPDTFIMGVNNM
jgi:hypothetical protein